MKGGFVMSGIDKQARRSLLRVLEKFEIPNVMFDFSRATFKSEDTNWLYKKAIPKRANVNTWFLILYPGEKKGGIEISYLRLINPVEQQ